MTMYKDVIMLPASDPDQILLLFRFNIEGDIDFETVFQKVSAWKTCYWVLALSVNFFKPASCKKD